MTFVWFAIFTWLSWGEHGRCPHRVWHAKPRKKTAVDPTSCLTLAARCAQWLRSHLEGSSRDPRGTGPQFASCNCGTPAIHGGRMCREEPQGRSSGVSREDPSRCVRSHPDANGQSETRLNTIAPRQGRPPNGPAVLRSIAGRGLQRVEEL